MFFLYGNYQQYMQAISATFRIWLFEHGYTKGVDSAYIVYLLIGSFYNLKARRIWFIVEVDYTADNPEKLHRANFSSKY